ncbi:MAG: hypothetical protein EXR61_05835 [Chloroflexi bacterium]|nr:hypothetical protein [Chloroflexota bacterium]
MPKELLPVDVTGTLPLRSAQSLVSFFGEPIEDPGPWLVAQAVPTDGAIILREGETPLLIAARRGQGAVFFLAFDPSLEPLRSWRGSANLWRYLMGYVSGQIQVPSNVVRQYVGWGRFPRNALSDLSPLRPPTAESLPWILLFYGLTVGPGSYLVLRRVGHLEWALWVMPLLTVGAAAAAFATARTSSESEVLFNKLSLVRASDTVADAYSRTYVSAFSPRDGTYDIEITGRDGPAEGLVSALFFPFPAPSGTPTPGAGAIRSQRGESTVLKNFSLDARALGTFQIDARVPADGSIKSHLKLGSQGLAGTVSNGTRGKISNAALVVGQEVVRLGDLAPGEVRNVVVPIGEGSPIGFVDIPSTVRQLYPNPGLATPVSTSDAMTRDILDSAFNSSFALATRLDLNPVSLVGWLDQSPITLQARNARTSELDRTLMVAHLTVDPTSGEDVRIPSAMIERRNLVAGTGRISQTALVMSSGETILFEYALPHRPDRFTIANLALDLGGSTPANVPLQDVAQAAIYDWPSAEWRDVPLVPGLNGLGDPARVVSALGHLRVRFTYRQTSAAAGSLNLDRFGLSVFGRGV